MNAKGPASNAPALGADMYRTLLILAALIAFAGPVASSPCTNNNWQPTFVHDLEFPDGPWHVGSQGSFTQLEWSANGGYVPHACRLVPDKNATRNPRGWTSCSEYMRVQCGCSRSIPGNSTCAAFLAGHTVAIPGPIAGGPNQPGGLANVAPPVPQPPPPIGAARSINVPASGFQQAQQYRGAVTPQGNSIVLTGGAWTNGRLANGAYDGNRIQSKEAYDFSAGGDGYMRIVANGAGKYMGFWPRVIEGVSVNHMSTHHSWANSVVVKDNEPVFAHVRVERGGDYRVTVASGNYDDQGGKIIYSNTGKLSNPRARLDLQFADNYAGEAASVTVSETIVKTAATPTATVEPAQPITPQAPPSGGKKGNGESCGAPEDCASSICLLGVCAPSN
jgi:hypothetical protein